AADSTTLSVVLPEAVSYVSAKVDRGPGCTAAGSTLTCPLGPFATNATSQVSLTVTVKTPGQLVCSASVASVPVDGDLRDNTAFLQPGGAPIPPTPPPAPVRKAASSSAGKKVHGTAKANRLVGTAHDDVLAGLGGNDTLLGGRGDDQLFGGPGN